MQRASLDVALRKRRPLAGREHPVTAGATSSAKPPLSEQPADLRGERDLPDRRPGLRRNPPRLAQDILNEAQLNMSVTQGVASFFIHSDDDPVSVLEQVVTGLKAEGYTFVSPQTLLADNG